MKVKLGDLIEEYSERNVDNKYKPVAVGKNGIRTRESIYSKELAKDYSKNKLIYKGTLTVGMGSNQIDIGILRDNETYSVSPAYHTYKIKIPNYDYLDYLLAANNNRMFSIYANRGSRQGKTLDLKRWLTDELYLHDEKDQKKIVQTLNTIKRLISQKETELVKLDNLIKARFVEMFGDIYKASKYPKQRWNDVVTIKNGKDYKKVAVKDGGYPVYGTGGEMARASEFLCPENTIIVGRKGTINNPLLVREKFWNVDTAFGVIPSNKIHYLYFFWFCKMFDFSRLNKQAVLPSTTKVDLLNIEIQVPPIEIQNQFAAFVAQIDKSKFTKPHPNHKTISSYKLSMRNFHIHLINNRISHRRINLRMAK